MQRRWGFRGWAMMWAVLQFALPALASVADARLEREAVGARTHVEAVSLATCRPSHDADCALCQSLSRPQAQTGGAPTCPVVIAVRAPAPSDPRYRVAAVLSRLRAARAPPAA